MIWPSHFYERSITLNYAMMNGPLTRYEKLRVAHAPGVLGTTRPQMPCNDTLLCFQLRHHGQEVWRSDVDQRCPGIACWNYRLVYKPSGHSGINTGIHASPYTAEYRHWVGKIREAVVRALCVTLYFSLAMEPSHLSSLQFKSVSHISPSDILILEPSAT